MNIPEAIKNLTKRTKPIRNQHVKLKRNSICPCEENEKRDEGDQLKYKNCCLKKMNKQVQTAFEFKYESKRIADAKAKLAESIKADIQEARDHPIIVPEKETVHRPNDGKIILP